MGRVAAVGRGAELRFLCQRELSPISTPTIGVRIGLASRAAQPAGPRRRRPARDAQRPDYLTVAFAYDRTTGSFVTRAASFDSSGAAAAAFAAGGPVIPGAYGVSHTFAGSRIVCAGPCG